MPHVDSAVAPQVMRRLKHRSPIFLAALVDEIMTFASVRFWPNSAAATSEPF